jgi:hypothetical protein
VNVELLGQLVERQQLALPLVMSDRCNRSMKHRRRNLASSTVPRSKGLERYRQQGCELSLSQTGRST